MFTKIFLPLFFAFFATPVFPQGGMLLPSTWPTETKDTIFRASVDGWKITKHTVPQGAVKWVYMFERGYEDTYENYCYDINQKQVFAHVSDRQKNIQTIWEGGVIMKPSNSFIYPPVDIDKIVWK